MMTLMKSRITTLVEGIMQRREGSNSTDEAALGDIAYEDALLDRQVRALLYYEQETAEPPPNVYAKVLTAIKLHQEQEARPRRAPYRNGSYARWREAIAAVWAAGLRANKSRALTGTVVALLLVLAVGPQVSQVLSGQASGASPYMSELDESYARNIIGLDGTENPTAATEPDDSLPDDAIASARLAQRTQRPRLSGSASVNEQHRILLEMKTGEDLHSYVLPEAPAQYYPRPVAGPY